MGPKESIKELQIELKSEAGKVKFVCFFIIGICILPLKRPREHEIMG